MGHSDLNGPAVKACVAHPDEINIVCGHEDTRERYNLKEDTEQWPFRVLEITSLKPISVEKGIQ